MVVKKKGNLKNNHKYHKYKKKYFLRTSNRRKPYLDQNRHVRKYNPKRIYKNKLKFYACGKQDHLSDQCPKRKKPTQ